MLSDDGMAIDVGRSTYADLDVSAANSYCALSTAKTVTIGGILVDASAVGNGEDIMATVRGQRRGGFTPVR